MYEALVKKTYNIQYYSYIKLCVTNILMPQKKKKATINLEALILNLSATKMSFEKSGTPVQDIVHDVITLLPALIDKIVNSK
jgi:hypothetical protein